MISRRNLFTALAGLVVAPVAAVAKVEPARVPTLGEWLQTMGRAPKRLHDLNGPFYYPSSAFAHMEDVESVGLDFGANGRATILAIIRKIEGRRFTVVHGGADNVQNTLERHGLPLPEGTKLCLDDGTVTTLGPVETVDFRLSRKSGALPADPARS